MKKYSEHPNYATEFINMWLNLPTKDESIKKRMLNILLNYPYDIPYILADFHNMHKKHIPILQQFADSMRKNNLKTIKEVIKEMENKIKTTYAVFAVIKLENNKYAATTRAADTGEIGKIGLPGGKVDPGESDIDALQRECMEEGWKISDKIAIEKYPTQTKYMTIKGFEYPRMIKWYEVDSFSVRKLTDYKEKHRISPIVATKEQILNSGYGNEDLYLK
jgi:hypothetical protein